MVGAAVMFETTRKSAGRDVEGAKYGMVLCAGNEQQK